MIQIFKKVLLAAGFIAFVASPVLAVASPIVSTTTAACDESGVLGIPPWYRGLTESDNGTGTGCNIAPPKTTDGNVLAAFIWKLVLNIINMALVIVAYIAVFFIIYGGFQFLTGGANPGQLENARKTLLNAIIGLVIALGSVAIVNLIFGIIK